MRRFVTVLSVGVLTSALLINVAAGAQPTLGTAGNYAVIAATAITNAGLTVINGNMAISPNGATSVTGFGPGVVTGTSDFNNAAAITASADLVIAYSEAAAEPFTVNLTGQDLGGLVLGPGVYRFDSSAQLTGTLILDGEGSTNPTFIFQIGSTLTTAPASSVQLINGAGGCAVFWQVGSSATLGLATVFQGTIMASASITMTTGVTIGVGGGSNGGRALALNAAVTLDSNVIIPPSTVCEFAPAATATPLPTETPTPTPVPTPEPTPVPTAVPTPVPTAVPTPEPTPVPTVVPTVVPTPVQMAVPTAEPTLVAAAAPAVGIPGIPDTSFSDQRDAPQTSTAAVLGVGVAIVILSLVLALRRRDISPHLDGAPRR